MAAMIWRPRHWLREYKIFAMVVIALCGRLSDQSLDENLTYQKFEAWLREGLAGAGVKRQLVERYAALGAAREPTLLRALDLLHAPENLRKAFLDLERAIMLAPEGFWQAIVAPQPADAVLAAAEPPDSPYRRIHPQAGTA